MRHQADIIAKAEYLWRNAADAMVWLTTPHPALDEHPPIEIAIDEVGTLRVERLLDTILHGLPT